MVTMKRMISSNDYYRGLNRRFDRRASRLRRLGFRYTVPEATVDGRSVKLAAIFYRPGLIERGQVISATVVMHSSNREYTDELSSVLRRSR